MSDLDHVVSRDLAALATANRHRPRALDDLVERLAARPASRAVEEPAAPDSEHVRGVVLAGSGFAALVCAIEVLRAIPNGWTYPLSKYTAPSLAIATAVAGAAAAWICRRIAVYAISRRRDVVDRRLERVARLAPTLAIAGLAALASTLGLLLLVSRTQVLGDRWREDFGFAPTYDFVRVYAVEHAVVCGAIAVGALAAAHAGVRRLFAHRAVLSVGLGLAVATIGVAATCDVGVIEWKRVTYQVPVHVVEPVPYETWDWWYVHTPLEWPSHPLRFALVACIGLASFLIVASLVARCMRAARPRLAARDDAVHDAFVRTQLAMTRHARAVAGAALLVVCVAMVLAAANALGRTHVPSDPFVDGYLLKVMPWGHLAMLGALGARLLARGRRLAGASSALVVAGVTSFVVCFGVLGFAAGKHGDLWKAGLDRVRDLAIVVPLVCIAASRRWGWPARPAALACGLSLGAVTLYLGFTFDVPLHETWHFHVSPSSGLRSALTASGTVAVFLVVSWLVARLHAWEDRR